MFLTKNAKNCVLIDSFLI